MTTIKKGQTFRKCIKLTDPNTGKAVNLTGCTAFAQMRALPGGTLAGTAECTVDALNGRVYALWDAELTSVMPTGNYGYDVWLVNEYDRKPIYTEQVKVVDRYTDNLPSTGE